MAALTNAMENRLLDWLLRGQALGLAGASAAAGSGPANTYVALFTGEPTDSGDAVEVVGGGYARVAVASSLASWAGTQGATTTAVSNGASGTTSNNVVITFPVPTAYWGPVVAVGLFDTAIGGTLLIYGRLIVLRVVSTGDAAPAFTSGSIQFQIDS